MNKILKMLLFMLIPLTSLGETPEELTNDLNTLVSNYDKAINRVTKPIDDKMVEELKKLLEKSNKDNNFEVSRKIVELIENINNKDSTSDSEKKDLFVNKALKSKVGTEFYFFEDKTGYMSKFGSEPKQKLKWSKSRELITVILDDTSEIFYFKYINDKLYFGKTKNIIDQPLTSSEIQE